MKKLDKILCRVLSSWGSPIFLPGGANIDLLRETSISKSYITILENHGLWQVVTKPTRNVLISIEHIITNLKNVTVTDALPCDQISDQNALYIITSMHETRYQTHYKYVRYKKDFDDVAFILDAEKLPQPLNFVFAVDDPEEKVHIFNQSFTQTLEEHIPLKHIKFSSPPAQWF